MNDQEVKQLVNAVYGIAKGFERHCIENGDPMPLKITKRDIQNGITKSNVEDLKEIVFMLLEYPEDENISMEHADRYCDWMNNNVYIKKVNGKLDLMIEQGYAYILTVDEQGDFLISLTEKGIKAGKSI